MTSHERRKHVRIQRQFEARLFNAKVRHETEGLTENISQGGAYVKTRDWRSFQTGDQATVTLFLPPSFTDKDKIFGLRGDAIVRRVDERNEGVALEFSRDLQEFEKVKHSEIAAKHRYKEISFYLHAISDLEFADTIRANPYGFLVEKSASSGDKAVFQFNALSLDDDHAMRLIERDFSITHSYLYLHPSSKGCYIVDCGSKNGTLLNGKALKPFEQSKLVDCDEICFGPQTKTVYFSSICFADFIDQLKNFYPPSDT